MSSGPSSNSKAAIRLAALAAAGIAAIVAFFLWGLPAIAGAIVSILPVSVEERIGSVVLHSMAPSGNLCRDDSVDRIAGALVRASPASRYRFRVYVVDSSEVNAFAAPGGSIVVFRGLIEKTKSPDELAAVLSHEMQHIIQRHGVKSMMRGLTLMTLISAAFGDAGGVVAQITGTLGQLHYARSDEASADREGMRMLERARVDPLAMVGMLRTLASLSGDGPAVLKYLSTHPVPAERVKEMERLAHEASYRRVPILPGVKWPPERSPSSLPCDAAPRQE